MTLCGPSEIVAISRRHSCGPAMPHKIKAPSSTTLRRLHVDHVARQLPQMGIVLERSYSDFRSIHDAATIQMHFKNPSERGLQ